MISLTRDTVVAHPWISRAAHPFRRNQQATKDPFLEETPRRNQRVGSASFITDRFLLEAQTAILATGLVAKAKKRKRKDPRARNASSTTVLFLRGERIAIPVARPVLFTRVTMLSRLAHPTGNANSFIDLHHQEALIKLDLAISWRALVSKRTKAKVKLSFEGTSSSPRGSAATVSTS